MIWVYQFSDNGSFYWNDQIMINTNDGYYFATAVKSLLFDTNVDNPQLASAFLSYPGVVYTTWLATKITSFSLETIILYMPAVISSLIVIPIVLTGRLMGHTVLGFFAALLGSVAWSYYNRTMVGYYDSDMFAVLFQFTIFYSFLHIVYKKELTSVLVATVFILIYPYFYPQGLTVIYAMFILLAGYLILEYIGLIKTQETSGFNKNAATLYGSIMLLSIALMFYLPLSARVILLATALTLLLKANLKEKQIIYISIILFIGFLIFGHVFDLIFSKLSSYLTRSVESEGLHFYQVIQTVREAGAIPLSTVANRISGSSIGLLLSLIGYVLLVLRHKPFIIALPLIGIGIFALWGGLRFTVYAVPVAAISAIYLFHVITTSISNKKSIYVAAMTLLTASMLYPNITHIIGYKVPTVLNNTEVQDLVKLDKLATDKDYTLSWWDYGYPIWYYSDTNTLIDGGKHHNDNYIISKVMQTSSPELAANLSRLAVETYVGSNYKTVANTLFKNRQQDQFDPNILLTELEDPNYTLPKKTRDVYLYLPYRMMRIFPTVAVFGNLDLTTGQEERKIAFYPTQAVSKKDAIVTFRNGITFDTQKGEISLGQQKKQVKHFIVTQNTKEGKLQLQSQLYHAGGEYSIVYMKSYGQFVVMDTETFKSTYVQMFMLEKYDQDLFELVVSSPYSKIYRLKK
jgi:dolichyl-diphosphooligosaccharide--protein glycosyltransferase/undecaprenyl-diphosphooligosaccharide--protein glycosyltransferase